MPPAFSNHITGSLSTNDVDETFQDSASTILPNLPSANNLTIENSTALQSATDKNILNQALDLIANVQNQLYNKQTNNFKSDPNNDDEDDDDSGGGGGGNGQNELIIDEPLLTDSDVLFNLQTPTLVPAYLNYHYVCESGSRLLFLSVYWIKKIPVFKMLR